MMTVVDDGRTVMPNYKYEGRAVSMCWSLDLLRTGNSPGMLAVECGDIGIA